jgi:hypothetical protein
MFAVVAVAGALAATVAVAENQATITAEEKKKKADMNVQQLVATRAPPKMMREMLNTPAYGRDTFVPVDAPFRYGAGGEWLQEMVEPSTGRRIYSYVPPQAPSRARNEAV